MNKNVIDLITNILLVTTIEAYKVRSNIRMNINLLINITIKFKRFLVLSEWTSSCWSKQLIGPDWCLQLIVNMTWELSMLERLWKNNPLCGMKWWNFYRQWRDRRYRDCNGQRSWSYETWVRCSSSDNSVIQGNSKDIVENITSQLSIKCTDLVYQVIKRELTYVKWHLNA